MSLVPMNLPGWFQVWSGSKGEELTVSITSPLCGAKADIATRSTDFAFGPKPDSCTAANGLKLEGLFDHLVGEGEHAGGDRQAECSGCL